MKIKLYLLLIFVFIFSIIHISCANEDKESDTVNVTIINNNIETSVSVKKQTKINNIENFSLQETDNYKLYQVLVNDIPSSLDYVINDEVTIKLVYKYKYNVNIKILDEEEIYSVFENESIKLKELSIPGYEFIGYFDGDNLINDELIVTSDITLIAKFSKLLNIKVVYLDEEESFIMKENEVLDLTSFIKEIEGYDFLGFYSDNIKLDEQISITDDLIIEAKYAKKCVITIESNFGTEEVVVAYNSLISDVVKKIDGYKIIYKNCSPSKRITSNMIIQIEYQLVNYYQVTFYDVHNNVFFSKQYEEGLLIDNVIYTPEEGYIFIEWDTEYSIAQEDLEIYPIYDVVEYTISYYDGEMKLYDFYTVESKDVILNELTLDGYRFLGWFTDENYQEKISVITKGSTGDITLYPLFEEIIYYDVYFELNGGKLEEFGFDDTYNVLGDFDITKFNEDFWDEYASNVFLYEINNDPKALYSLRAGLRKINDNNYQVVNVLLSGDSSSNADYSSCDFILVVSSHNGVSYNNLKYLLKANYYIVIPEIEKLITDKIAIKATVNEKKQSENYKRLYDGYVLPVPEYQGYEFLGWKDQNGEIVEMLTRDMNTLDNKIYLAACWKRILGTPLEEVARIFSLYDEIFRYPLLKDVTLIDYDEETNATLRWEISDESILSPDGKIHPQETTQTVTVSLSVTYLNEIYKKSYDVIVYAKYKDIYSGDVVAGYNYFNVIPDEETLKNVDILYCAFGAASPSGKISNYNSIKTSVSSYINLAHKYGDYVSLCISTSNLAEVAKSSATIKVFVQECIKAINEIGFDGIDIDWETPTLDTKTNFTALMKELYTQVKANNPAHIVTAATGGGPWQYPRYDLENSIKYIDFINLMTYSMHSSGKSSHQSALYNSSKGYLLSNCSIDQTIKYYNNCNVPNNKILVGVPFYAIGLAETEGIGKPCVKNKAYTQTYLYDNYFSKTNLENVIIGFDDECKVPYIYDGNTKMFYTYDNEKSIKYKAAYIKEKELGGFMYWQNGQDRNHMLLKAMYSQKENMK